MQEIIEGLWISDYVGSQDAAQLERHNIKNVVTAMRQKYDSTLNILHVPIDDTDSTNIIVHFPTTNAFIDEALERDEGVLVHCQAGVSRSTTIATAYLMATYELNVEQAVAMVKRVRSQVEPTPAFMHQLEMYERCQYEWNPVKYKEQRRFLMNFAQAEIMGGSSPSIVMAYYPSPAPSPRGSFGAGDSGGLKMTPVDVSSVNHLLLRRRRSSAASAHSSHGLSAMSKIDSSMLGSAIDTDEKETPPPSTPMRKRLTAKGTAPSPVTVAAPPKKDTVMERIGSKAEVVVTGRRIRCKMCRRELAAREHIVAHDPGMGQQAFAPHRRDMAAHRAEQERRKMEEQKRNRHQPSAEPSAAVTPPLAGLRISRPPGERNIPGLRVAQPNPNGVSRPPVTRPSPPQAAQSEAEEAEQNRHQLDKDQEVTEEPAELHSDERPPSPDHPLLTSSTCSSYFVEPLSWMSSILEGGALAGKIECPNKKCGAKLGSFDWAGGQCSCGAWVCPGFALNVSRVDEYRPASPVPS